MKKAPKILYFIEGSVPTEDDIAEAESLGSNVKFRNAEFVGDESPEVCDGVAGAVPEAYKKYPDAEKALAAYKSGKELPKPKETKPAAKAEESGEGKAPAGGKPAAGWQGGK